MADAGPVRALRLRNQLQKAADRINASTLLHASWAQDGHRAYGCR